MRSGPRRLSTAGVRILRFVAIAWWLHVKMIAVSAFDGFLKVVWPLFFATVTMLVYRVNGDQSALVYAGLGAAVMGMWSAMATTATMALQRERSEGMLELVAGAPTPLGVVLAPITVALATVGLYSLVVVLVWARILVGVSLIPANPVGFGLSVAVTIVATGMFGFVLSLLAVRYRTAWALGNMLEYPGWLVCGFIIPLVVLPSWLRPVSYALAPTWGMAAIREAAAGGWPWSEISLCALLAVAYGVIGVLLSRVVLRSARRHASLSLS
jgi:ABC-2 type transport system permease protein